MNLLDEHSLDCNKIEKDTRILPHCKQKTVYSHSTDEVKGLCCAFLKILSFMFLIGIKYWFGFKTRVLSKLPGLFCLGVLVLVGTKKLKIYAIKQINPPT